MNQVTASGHTAMSWAAARGFFEAMDEMLLHGASVGFTSDLIHLNATYLQQSYRLYRLLTSAQKKMLLAEVDASVEVTSGQSSVQIIEQVFALKEARARVLAKIVFRRRKIRMPIPEAAFAGKWEIVRRILDRRMYHHHFSNSWCNASPPPPYTRAAAISAQSQRYTRSTKTDMWTLLEMGEKALNSGRYDGDVGWVQTGDPRTFYGEARVELTEVIRLVQEKINKKVAERKRVRALTLEKKNRVIGESGMVEAIKKCDFRLCVFLSQHGSSSIDFETEDGYTALIAAAEENIVVPNHEYMLNEDGLACLAVEYLLDRDMYRPAVNLESHVTGMTALMKASQLSRRHVVQALLDRGANPNHVNVHGKTALHYAARTGDLETTRILLERGVDTEIKDNEGNTAFAIAEDMGFMTIMMKISQFRSGFMGNVRVTRGMVEDTIKCPLGCGKGVSPYEARFHVLECPYREVECPQGCNVRLLQFRELDKHMSTDCGRRPILCFDCKETYLLCDEKHHLTMICKTREVPCPLGCDATPRFMDLEKHCQVCVWRLMECPYKCGALITLISSFEHTKSHCPRRRVICPRQCGAWIMDMNLAHHLEDTCSCRPVPCQYCEQNVEYRAKAQHESRCDQRSDLCPAKCGEIVRIADLPGHLAETCSHRFVECTLACGIKVRYNDMELHQQNECTHRMVSCPNECVELEDTAIMYRRVCQIQAKELPYHMGYTCKERLIICSMCTQPVKAKVMEVYHKISECTHRLVSCRNVGCFKSMHIQEREDHERSKCRFRLVPCVQGCGELVVFIRTGKHNISTCEMRYEECPLRCGVTLRFKLMKSHLDNECVRKFAVTNLSVESSATSSPYGAFSVSKPSTALLSSAKSGSSSRSPSRSDLNMSARSRADSSASTGSLKLQAPDTARDSAGPPSSRVSTAGRENSSRRGVEFASDSPPPSSRSSNRSPDGRQRK